MLIKGISLGQILTLLDDKQDIDAETHYFGDADTDGSWQITKSGTDLKTERRESGSWNTKESISP